MTSCTLMALLETTFLQQQVGPTGEGKDQGASPEANTVSEGRAEAVVVKDGQPCKILQGLVQVAGQISRLDCTVDQAKACQPESNCEARKWHDISLTAMMWSRRELVEKQLQFLAQLRDVVLMTKEDNQLVQEKCACPQQVAERVALPEESAPPSPIGSLRIDLEKLRQYDSDCCLIVRKIKKLGLDSADKLEGHFRQFGDVAEVLVAHSYERPSPKRRNGRVRPAALGFVVMKTAEGSSRAVEAGELQAVGAEALDVSVQRFEAFGEMQAMLEGEGQ